MPVVIAPHYTGKRPVVYFVNDFFLPAGAVWRQTAAISCRTRPDGMHPLDRALSQSEAWVANHHPKPRTQHPKTNNQ